MNVKNMFIKLVMLMICCVWVTVLVGLIIWGVELIGGMYVNYIGDIFIGILLGIFLVVVYSFAMGLFVMFPVTEFTISALSKLSGMIMEGKE